MNNNLNLDLNLDLNLSMSLLDGIHEDDHEKITILKNNSINDFSINDFSINNDYIPYTCVPYTHIKYNINNSVITTYNNILDLSNYIDNNTNLLYLRCTSIMIGSIIKYFS